MIGIRPALQICAAGVAALALGGATMAAQAAPDPAAAIAAVGWKQIYETNQTTYYVSSATAATSGDLNVETLMQFKVPQVVDGAQVWSMMSRMQVNCQSQQLMTVENTFYAMPMGGGKAIRTQAASDNWHNPDPDSLGELVWNTSCGKG